MATMWPRALPAEVLENPLRSACQIASNCDPHFASNNDPLIGL